MNEQRYLYLLRRYRNLGIAKNLDFSETVEHLYQMRLTSIALEVESVGDRVKAVDRAASQRDREFLRFTGVKRQVGKGSG